MAATYVGILKVNLSRDKDGHRDYVATYRVTTSSVNDGPATVLGCTGLPTVGSSWSHGGVETDIWAFCTPETSITMVDDKENTRHWNVTRKFTTRPLDRDNNQVANPLLEPDKISGNFVKFLEEINEDKDGNVPKSSSHEKLFVEFDANRPAVRIEQNRQNLELSLISQMVDTVNNAALWGLGTRRVKLSNVTWSKHYYGNNLTYYKRILDFDVNYNTFDKVVADEGTKVIRGSWSNASPPVYTPAPGANASDPTEFVRAVDAKENPIHAFLNGSGSFSTSNADINAAKITVQKYAESNFLLLGIPTVL